ncbi:hypothetical protein [Sessilibacter corallicola]|uniref:hypothetical protein n=1 Tax=Sessilibacter corallicola TaxID=2904075 RepID=UPI001E37A456|nr:hypothetical protein [Sessilibacter corallicola]MCE2028996.1 hypothetical protein [Sessilibacter corallicola]
MKVYNRLFEPSEFQKIIEGLESHTFDEETIPSDLINILERKVLHKIASELEKYEIKIDATTLDFHQLKNISGAIKSRYDSDLTEDTDYLLTMYSALVRLLNVIEAFKSKNVNEGIVHLLGISEVLLRTHKVESPKNFPSGSYNLLSSEIPEIGDMAGSTTEGQLAQIIQKARNIWVDDEGHYPEWKHEQAARLKNSYSFVFQYANRYENESRAKQFQTPEAPLAYLDCQLPDYWVLKFVRDYRSSCKLDERLPKSHIFSAFAIYNAFYALADVWHKEYHDETLDDKYTRIYYGEAQGFLSKALKYKTEEEQDNLFEEKQAAALSKSQSNKAKQRNRWRDPVATRIEELFSADIKTNMDVGNVKLARRWWSELNDIRIEIDGAGWQYQEQATDHIKRVISKLKKKISTEV